MPDTERKPFPQTIEVFPSRATENQQPVHATWISVSGGGLAPLSIDFYYLSAAFWRRITLGETGDGIDRATDDHVICHLPPAARIALPLANAADLIVSLYAYLQNAELRSYVDQKLSALRKEQQPKVEGE